MPRSIALQALVISALLGSAAPAHAQQWGGGGVTTREQPAAAIGPMGQQRGPFFGQSVMVTAPLIFLPAPSVVEARMRRHETRGGSWNGAQPTWGGSPPEPPEPRHRRGFVFRPPTVFAPVQRAAVAAVAVPAIRAPLSALREPAAAAAETPGERIRREYRERFARRP